MRKMKQVICVYYLLSIHLVVNKQSNTCTGMYILARCIFWQEMIDIF